MQHKQMQRVAGLCLAGSILFGSTAAHASYDELLKALEENNSITAEQAAALKSKAPTYVRPSSKVIKDLAMRGRVHAQFGLVETDNDEGSDDFSTFEIRRARIGMRGTLFDNVRAQVEANIVPGSDFSMRAAFLQWREHKPAYIKLGYDKPRSSIEENTSSSEILTIERSLINGLVAAPGQSTGLALDGKAGILQYGLGVYTDQANRNTKNEDAEYMLNGMVAVDLGDMVGEGHSLLLRGNLLTSDDAEGSVGGDYPDDVVTFGGKFGAGAFGLSAEYFMGDNDGNETTGFYVMPSMYLTEKLQAVVRFEQAESDEAHGIKAPSRYVRDVPSLKVVETLDDAGEVVSKVDPQAGDEYSSIYVGLNYYFSGHAHKVMLGLEVAELKKTDAGDLDATSVTTAWRMLF